MLKWVDVFVWFLIIFMLHLFILPLRAWNVTIWYTGVKRKFAAAARK